METLAVKYRPKTFSELVGQDVVRQVISNQVATGKVKNAYLFCGTSGSGKTSISRILAHDLNDDGMITELDAASHSGADDARIIVEESKFKPIGQKYRIFIIDEAHSLSNTAWQVFLKAIEEPTPTSIFIFCTTDPQKIPKTILTRVQRYDFHRIPSETIVDRLKFIIESENKEGNNYTYTDDALLYIAKLSDGGMRSAITYTEEILEYSNNITIDSVVKTLGTVNYGVMFDLTDSIVKMNKKAVIDMIESIYDSGFDLKLFVSNYSDFILDLCKYDICKSFDYVRIPNNYSDRIKNYSSGDFKFFIEVLNEMVNLASEIKWDSSPRYRVEASMILLCSPA